MEVTKDAQIMGWIKKRVASSHYIISEHVIRFIMAEKVSIQEIEGGLLQGKIIEIHRHPVRGSSFLVLGYPDSRPVHVMCASREDGWLLIIFAYVPSPPIWEDPMHRREGGMIMEDDSRKCFFCGGDIKDITVGNFDYRLEGQLYVVKKVPAGLCVQCGEKYITAESARKLNEKIAERKYSGTESVFVLEFD